MSNTYASAAQPTQNVQDIRALNVGDKVYHPKHGNGIVVEFGQASVGRPNTVYRDSGEDVAKVKYPGHTESHRASIPTMAFGWREGPTPSVGVVQSAGKPLVAALTDAANNIENAGQQVGASFAQMFGSLFGGMSSCESCDNESCKAYHMAAIKPDQAASLVNLGPITVADAVAGEYIYNPKEEHIGQIICREDELGSETPDGDCLRVEYRVGDYVQTRSHRSSLANAFRTNKPE